MVPDRPADIIAGDRQKSLKKGNRMMPDPVVLAATVILLFPMGFFLMSAPAFLLVKLDIPQVTQLLRGLFSAYFLMVSIAGAVGTVAFALTGRLLFAIGIGLIAAFAIWARALVSATHGCRAHRPGCRRSRRGAPVAPAALGRHAV